jgi:hypothetical protein
MCGLWHLGYCHRTGLAPKKEAQCRQGIVLGGLRHLLRVHPQCGRVLIERPEMQMRRLLGWWWGSSSSGVWRREKRADNHRGMLTLAAILLWW